MRIPQPPTLRELAHLTPSLYEAALQCPARATWYAFGDRNAVPQSPYALLGSCSHKVMELANKGQLAQSQENLRDAARQVFDQEAQSLYEKSHRLFKEKFPSSDRIPYYYLYRERVALQATTLSTRHAQSFDKNTSVNKAEVSLQSCDGLLKGRADYIDLAKSEVIDYKMGTKSEVSGTIVSEAEKRQLRLYVYLSLENDLQVTKGVIFRGNYQRATIEVPHQEAAQEAQDARSTLSSINQKISSGQSFRDMAQPSSDHCKGCSCIPFCEAFWESANPRWFEQCGTHVEAEITQTSITHASEDSLVTLEIIVRRGTLEQGQAFIEQIPLAWIVADGTELPQIGNVVRVVDARKLDSSNVINVNKISTTIWKL